jgi:cobalamin biosynthesis Mg chelatase CobN
MRSEVITILNELAGELDRLKDDLQRKGLHTLGQYANDRTNAVICAAEEIEAVYEKETERV